MSRWIVLCVVWCFAVAPQAVRSAPPQAVRSVPARAQFNIVAYGAVGDGVTVNTRAIAAAVAAAAASGLPSSVLVPPGGVFVTGGFNLSSHVYLEVAPGGELRASDAPEDYVCMASVTSDTGERRGAFGQVILRLC